MGTRAFRMRTVLATVLPAAAFALVAVAAPARAARDFIAFESGPVRPLAASPDGTRLFAANVPDARLEIFDVTPSGLDLVASVPVGLEPVAVAAPTNDEVWVVNHLSDSVSIVSLAGTARVVRTLLVGDEPQDIVFAGAPGALRAFISTAHRGQNSPYPTGEYDVPGIGRADVWVFDVADPGPALGGTPVTILTLFGDRPRALATSADGATVYASVFHSGNRTTTVHEGLVCDSSEAVIEAEAVQGPCATPDGTSPGGYPPPHRNHEGLVKRETSLIVKQDRQDTGSSAWLDELGRDWSALVRFDLPDLDVFAIDATADPPVEVDAWASVGTTLMSMLAHPGSGRVFVANTDAHNHLRFEGPGTLAAAIKPPGEPASLRGNIAHARISILDPVAGTVTPRHLNKHLDYTAVPQPADARLRSLSQPTGLALSADGQTLYVAAYGSAEVGVFDVAELEADTFTPDAATHIAVGGGPSGLVLLGSRLFVHTRFDNSIAIVDLTQGTVGEQVERVRLHNPEPRRVVEGRPFLYDARATGSNGEAACASCHPFADVDDLAWDLGDPDGDVTLNTNPALNVPAGVPLDFHPTKGPMTTQSLRGLVRNGPQHWRGDRTGDARDAFAAFNVAFPGLVGRDEGEIAPEDMEKFTDFIMEVFYPPNPGRALDDSLTPLEAEGFFRFSSGSADTAGACDFCHDLEPAFGFFGTRGQSSHQTDTVVFKIPHLRNQYQKVGMFGMARVPRSDPSGDFSHQGPQVRGFGFLHDGAFDTTARFLASSTFNTSPDFEVAVDAYMQVFDTDLAPMTGQQVTRRPDSAATVDQRIDAMVVAAATPYPSLLLGSGAMQCDVVVHGIVDGIVVGGLLEAAATADPVVRLDGEEAPVALAELRAEALVPGQELTWTCVPWGSGRRAALDRDGDGVANRLDNCPAVANPTQADDDDNGTGNACEPGATTTTTTSTTSTTTSTTMPPPADLSVESLVVSRLTRGPRAQSLALALRIDGPEGETLDPAGQLFSLVLTDGRSPVGGGEIAAADPGWRTSANGRAHKWRGRDHVDGLRSVVVRLGAAGAKVRARFKETEARAAASAPAIDVRMQSGADVFSGRSLSCFLAAGGDKRSCR